MPLFYTGEVSVEKKEKVSVIKKEIIDRFILIFSRNKKLLMSSELILFLSIFRVWNPTIID